ncbi:hypothetical protein MTO96_050337, partial [Rhipicephalus appendiculatus]
HRSRQRCSDHRRATVSPGRATASTGSYRREFLVANQGRFNENRVLCLAQAFANVELLGCTCPGPVMAQVNELAKNVGSLSVVQEKRRESDRVLFVKGEDDDAKEEKTSSLGTCTRAPRYDDQSRMRAASFFQR